jgi:undecaprenyl diphosphate synthase
MCYLIYKNEVVFRKDVLSKIPKHVGIIMDGNRRWAKKRGLSSFQGHFAGSNQLTAIVKAAILHKIKVLTVYCFSTENWKRSKKEVSYLIKLFEKFLKEKKDFMQTNGVRLCTIGDLSVFPAKLQKTIQDAKDATEEGTTLDLVLALNYGARDEIIRATKKILNDYSSNKRDENLLNEKEFSSYLDTALWPDPDLIIRTGGEFRLSNFLLWQISYAEIVVLDVLWPEFTEKHLEEALEVFQKREIRGGK